MRRPGTNRPVSRLAAMPGRPQIALLACLSAVALGGCGSDEEGTIPVGNSNQLVQILEGIEDNVAGGNCELAQDQANELVDAANALPAEPMRGNDRRVGIRRARGARDNRDADHDRNAHDDGDQGDDDHHGNGGGRAEPALPGSVGPAGGR